MMDIDKPPKMIAFLTEDWSWIKTNEAPLELLLRERIPVYFKVDRSKAVVHMHYRRVFMPFYPNTYSAPTGILTKYNNREIITSDVEVRISTLTFQKLDKDISFLRINEDALIELILYGFTHVREFNDDGISIPARYEIIDHPLNRKHLGKSISDLTKIEFDKAFLVDIQVYAVKRNPLIELPTPEELVITVEVRSDDLYLLSSDIEELRRKTAVDSEYIIYPYTHKERMPGIYWMFQAAYAHNELKLLQKDDVKEWLFANAPKDTYRHKSWRTAIKFVWPNVDRFKGGKARGEFILDDLDEWAERKEFEFSFISKGLSFILAIADWWVEILERAPNEPNSTLAKKLIECKFSGLEIYDLVYLLAGSKLTEEDFVKAKACVKRV